MSLARAFTKRTKRPEALPSRAQSTRQKNSNAFDRGKISSPVALISTTNMLSYNAPDIPTVRQVSNSSSASTSSRSSGEDSDRSALTASSNTSRETLTDASSIDSSPTSPPSPNHLSCYFQAANPNVKNALNVPAKHVRRAVSSSSLHSKSSSLEGANAPAIPQRALSHSKRAHEQLARKRSLQHVPGSSPRASRNSSPRSSHQSSSSRSERPSIDSSRTSHQSQRSQSRASVDMFSGKAVEDTHPFGRELEQLNEVAEEFHEAVRDVEIDEDTSIMRKKGLVKLCAADYMTELEPLYASVFHDTRHLMPQMAWI